VLSLRERIWTWRRVKINTYLQFKEIFFELENAEACPKLGNFR
jgi:hypothetical protein